MSNSYVVVTPVRDEEEHLLSTIECMLRQTVLPIEWVIVNDGSTDNTGKIIDDYAARYSWIKAVHRADRGFRKPGGGIVDAFNDGYQALTREEWDFVVKFDGDLTFDDNYFEQCLHEFDLDPKLGIGGGTLSHITHKGKTIPEKAPAFHVRGTTKIYRKTCWDDIGGLVATVGWDTIDEVKANSIGWKTRSFPHLHLIHKRQTGSADGFWRSCIKYGRANYICGYHPLFMAGKCLKRSIQKPYVIGSFVLAYGYITGFIMRVPRVNEPGAIAYLRTQQINHLLRRDSIWGLKVNEPGVLQE